MSVVSLAFTVVARLDDVRAFNAVATAGLYCWLALGIVCAIGVLVTAYARRAGARAPWHLRAALLVGVACSFLTLPTAVQVLTKEDAAQAAAAAGPSGTPMDLRDQVVQDRSFADADLRRAQLSGATLRHVDLGGSDLSEADLRGTRLRNVNMSGTNLCGADLRGADLRGAHGLDAVKSWAYVFYDRRTRTPEQIMLFVIPGPIPDTGRDLLYMCTADETRRIAG